MVLPQPPFVERSAAQARPLRKKQRLWQLEGRAATWHCMPRRRPALTSLLLLLAFWPSSAALAAPTTTTPNAAIAQLFANLRGSAEAEVKKGTEAMQASAKEVLQKFEGDIEERAAEVEMQHKAAMKDINGPAEVALGQVKRTLDAARLKAADVAKGAALSTVAVVQRDAEREVTSLAGWAKQLQDEAQQRKAEAKTSAVDTKAAVAEARNRRAQWPRDEIQRSIDVAKEAGARAPEMHGFASDAEALDAELDNEAMRTLGVVQEAVRHTQNAAVTARTAVDQAAQNAVKLKTIRELINGAAAATTAAEESQIEAALAR